MTDYRLEHVELVAWSCDWPGCNVRRITLGTEEHAAGEAQLHIDEHHRLDPEGTYSADAYPEDWRALRSTPQHLAICDDVGKVLDALRMTCTRHAEYCTDLRCLYGPGIAQAVAAVAEVVGR